MKIKTPIETVAKFIGAAAWADGVFDEAEIAACQEIADVLEVNDKKFVESVRKTFDELQKVDEDKLNEYLIDVAVDIDEDDVNYIFECALGIVLSDGVLQKEEVDNLISIADALGIDEAIAILMLCDMVKEEKDLTIEIDSEKAEEKAEPKPGNTNVPNDLQAVLNQMMNKSGK